MSLDPDWLLDRRRLKRQLAAWRVAAVLLLVGAILAGVARFDDLFERDHIARLTVDGVIVEDRDRIEAIYAVRDNDAAQALIVHVNSPGGQAVGGEDLYRALRDVAAVKPVVATMGTVAASAGYMTASAADRIFAREGTITGSIGVILQSADITGLLEKLGVRAESFKSAPLKAQPNPLEPLTEEARAATQALVMRFYDTFIDIVAESRPLERDEVLALADGRVFTGAAAVDNRLVDAIGSERQAVAWLEATHGLDPGLAVREVEIEREDETFDRLMSLIAGKTVISEALILDGLVAVWHPELN